MIKRKKLFVYTILSIVTSLFLTSYVLDIGATLYASSSKSININDTNLNYKREMRGVWVASVYNLHVPNGLDEEGFRKWADELTSDIANLNFNTILFQVRPMADALYVSELVPTSHFINGGNQGDYLNYDPLEIMIESSHANGLEFHAWLNPYRVTTYGITLDELCPNNIAIQNPNWIININNQYIFNPGIPDVQKHIVDVVMELVNNYDIDAIHFDDYFYPSPHLQDQHTFEVYGGNFTNIDDWRRNNVTTLIESVYYNINKTKPWVQFGISPFGIWRNSSTDITGSDTDGIESYDYMFADSREWIKRGIIDYITPQIYWSTDFEVARYDILANWWEQQIELYATTRPVRLYIGTADYKVNNNSDLAWEDPYQLPNQIQLNRSLPNIQGQMHYAVIHLFRNELGYMDIIQQELYNTMALTPSVYWHNTDAPLAPSNITATNTLDGIQLVIDNDDETTRRHVIYRFKEGEEVSFKNENILGVIFKNNTNTFIDRTAKTGYTYRYAAKSISYTGVISEQATITNYIIR